MRLTELTVRNYRSIIHANRLPLGQGTIIVGPNNEGKTNLLKALATAMGILVHGRRTQLNSKGSVVTRFSSRNFYDYGKDFPIDLQRKGSQAQTIIDLVFELNDSEIVDFRSELGSSLNGVLPLKITLDNRVCEVRVVKRGRGGPSLSKKSTRVASFVSKRLDFDYIPAIRTAEQSEQVVSTLVARELATLESDPAYQRALEQIDKLQRPILDDVQKSIKTTLCQFLPTIKAVKVDMSPESRLKALRSCRVRIDDGVETDLSAKGDGVQSLSALGIMRHASQSRSKGKNLVIAIEEPESHLHPGAQHELRSVIADLAREHQIVISTHCPLFVDRSVIGNNIVVQNNSASVSSSIAHLREVLGVRVADNLHSAEVVLICEGDDDIRSIRAILASCSQKIKSAIDDNRLVFDAMNGAGNMSHRIASFRSQVCRVRCLLDDDQSARNAYAAAEKAKVIDARDIHITKVSGKDEAEFEDLLDPNFVNPILLSDFGVSDQNIPRHRKSKWSDRVGGLFEASGKPWNDAVKAHVKATISEAVAMSGGTGLMNSRRMPVDTLVTSLESDLQ